MKKVITVVGARPQFIKAAIVSQQFSKSDTLEEIIVHTGQHYDPNMSNVFFNELSIPKPAHTLDVNNCSHAEMTGKMLIELDKVFDIENPDAILVYGDTNSTLAASLVAAKRNVPIFHVEAGLRSNNKKMPEEINRIVTDHVSSLLFTPCANASNILVNEGLDKDNIKFVGDVMYDIFLQIKPKLNIADKNEKKYVACTIHRQDNTDDASQLISIFERLDGLCDEVNVIMPLHPRTKNKIDELGIKTKVEFIEPLSYIQMMELVANSEFVITDSGGLQKEAFFNNKICITIRKETEWVELLDIKWNELYDPKGAHSIIDCFRKLNREKQEDATPYGDGDASFKILNYIEQYLG